MEVISRNIIASWSGLRTIGVGTPLIIGTGSSAEMALICSTKFMKSLSLGATPLSAQSSWYLLRRIWLLVASFFLYSSLALSSACFFPSCYCCSFYFSSSCLCCSDYFNSSFCLFRAALLSNSFSMSSNKAAISSALASIGNVLTIIFTAP